MKFSTVLTGALAAVASAAPTAEQKRGQFDASQLNNLAFSSQDLSYLNIINSLDVSLLQQLAVNNNLNAAVFQSLFSSSQFNVNSILQLQQLQTVLQLAQLGVFNTFDLSTLNLQVVNLGLIQQNVGAFDLSSVIDAQLVPQITTIVQQGVVPGKE